MLQYLINTSAIWLMSLVLFDIFLRRENYHHYNRLYLASSLLLGLFLPLLKWKAARASSPTPLYNAMVYNAHTQTTTHIYSIKKLPAATNHLVIDWLQVISIIYLAGVLISTLQLVRELYRLQRYYIKGKKSKQYGWTIVETGESHGPFSFFNYLYLGNVDMYSAAQLEIILKHENEHKRLQHFADLLLIQLTQIIFWFHPLVYIYKRRMLLVQEYQADKILDSDAATYGSFLIETSLMQHAPGIAHSFSHSPIKNRLDMLARRNTKGKTMKLLIIVPLIACSFLFFTECKKENKMAGSGLFSAHIDDHNQKASFVTYKGNVFEIPAPIKIQLPAHLIGFFQKATARATGKSLAEIKKMDTSNHTITTIGLPEKMNGEHIYTESEKNLIAPIFTGQEKNINEYLFVSLAQQLARLKDGSYIISSPAIVGKSGKVVYSDHCELSGEIEPGLKAEISDRMTALVENVSFQPARLNGQPVIAYTGQITLPNIIVIKDHKATLKKIALTKLD